MKASITFRHMDATEALKTHIRERLEKVEKIIKRPMQANVVLSFERHLHSVELSITSKRKIARAHEATNDMYASIDLAVGKIEKILKKQKEKAIDEHHTASGEG